MELFCFVAYLLSAVTSLFTVRNWIRLQQPVMAFITLLFVLATATGALYYGSKLF